MAQTGFWMYMKIRQTKGKTRLKDGQEGSFVYPHTDPGKTNRDRSQLAKDYKRPSSIS